LETAERKYVRWIQGMAAKQKRRKHYADVGTDRKRIILKQISKQRACEVGASDLG
jgi:hypothetical protein